MTHHYEPIKSWTQGPLEIIVDRTWEDLHPRDCFDDSVEDIEQLCRDIDSGKYEWFTLRVRVMWEDIELAVEYLGGMLYEDPTAVLTDGSAQDLVNEALAAAQQRAGDINAKIGSLTDWFFLTDVQNS